MTHNDNRRKWRNYFINKDIQRRIITINLIYMFLVMLLTIGAMLYSSVNDLFGTHEIKYINVTGMNISMSSKLYFILAITFMLAVANQLWLTHQFCGSLVNFINTFKKVSKGDLTQKIVLRKTDLLKKEANQFNEMIEKLSALIAIVKEDNGLLLATLKEVTAEGGTADKIEEARKIINQQEQLFNEHLSQLRLTT